MAASQVFSAIGSYGAQNSGTWWGSILSAVGGAKKNANGGVYATPSLSAMSGSVVSSPTIFPFANGGALGLMGEAGSEAIMPLKRLSNGKLGVQAQGAGGVSFSQSITVNSDGSSNSETDTTSQSAAAKAFADRMRSVAQEEIVRQMRPGGILTRMN